MFGSEKPHAKPGRKRSRMGSMTFRRMLERRSFRILRATLRTLLASLIFAHLRRLKGEHRRRGHFKADVVQTHPSCSTKPLNKVGSDGSPRRHLEVRIEAVLQRIVRATTKDQRPRFVVLFPSDHVVLKAFEHLGGMQISPALESVPSVQAK